MVNAGIISGAIIAAFVLPPNGVSSLLPALIAIAYISVGLFALRKKKFNSDF
jgi:hypothetical protein